MKIDIRFRGIEPSASLREHAERQVRSHLGRFGPEVGRVLVRVGDVNGPKGGLDKRCHVTARGPRGVAATVEETSGDAYSAVDWAVERLARSVERTIGRARDAWRHGSPVPGRAS